MAAIDRKYHSLIRSTIEEQLTNDPVRETRNRKPLRRPAEIGARWELRFGPSNRFRVYYRVDEDAGQVHVLVTGMKDRDWLLVGGEEVGL